MTKWWMSRISLESDQFVEDMLAKIECEQSLDDIPKSQKCAPPKPLEYYAAPIDDRDRDRAVATAYLDGHYTLQEVGSQFGVSYATVSRAVKRH
jgi:putative transposase